MEVTINLNWDSSNHTYSLTSCSDKLCQISEDKQSYIIFNKTYTPIIQYDGGYVQRYRLVSYSFASASNVGVVSRSGTTSGNPNTTSDYTSSEVRYYTYHSTPPTYDYDTARIDVNSTSGAVSGDTDACSYTLQYDRTIVITGWNTGGAYNWTADVDVLPNKQLSTVSSNTATLDGLAGTELFTPFWTDTALVGPDGNTYLVDSALAKTYYWADGYSRYSPRSVNATVSNNGMHISMTYRREDAITEFVNTNYTFESVSWNSTWNGYTRVGSSTSDTGGAGYTYATKQYRRLDSPGSSWYDPDFYSSFTFNASTGQITWSHRDGNTSYYNKVEQYSTINVEDESYYQYNITSLDWNYSDEYNLCTIIEETTSYMIIDIPDVGWVFIDETTGERKEGQLIKFIDETTGTETMIKKVQANNNGILSRYLRTTTKKNN